MFSLLGLTSAPEPDEACKQEKHTLSWRDLTYTIGNKRKGRAIIQGMSGRAKPGRLLGILGPSGSGKVGGSIDKGHCVVFPWALARVVPPSSCFWRAGWP